MRVFNASITVETDEGTEVADITKPVRDAVEQRGGDGQVLGPVLDLVEESVRRHRVRASIEA